MIMSTNRCILALLIFNFLGAGISQAMDANADQPLSLSSYNEVLRFKIGQYKAYTTRNTIEQFGGLYLNGIIGGKFSPMNDSKGRIVIYIPQEDGELFFYFIHYHSLPTEVSELVARRTANFFGLETMLKIVHEKWPKTLKPVTTEIVPVISPKSEDDELFCFNIGGYKQHLMRRTIKQFGGPFLNTLISGKFKIVKDDKGRIFIDRPKKEGELLINFILTQMLPEKLDEKVARETANYFGIETMLNAINDPWPIMSEPRKIRKTTIFTAECGECNKYHPFSTNRIDEATTHLIHEHQAKIIEWSGSDEDARKDTGNKFISWEIIYQVNRILD